MKQAFVVTTLAWAVILHGSVVSATTTFFKSSDMVDLVTTDHSGTAYLLFEDANKKQKIELCKCNGCSFYHTYYRHARFRLSPTVNSSSICILSDGQFFKFPMPTFKNGGPIFPPNTKFSGLCRHQHNNAITYNEFELKDISAAEPAVEISFRTFEGEPARQLFSGKDGVGELYKRLNKVIDEMKVDTAPQYADVFGTGELLVTKGDVIELKEKVKSAISAFRLKMINANAATSSTTVQKPTDEFTGTGPQGMASFDYSQNDGVFTIRIGNEVFKTKWSRYTAKRVYAHADLSRAIGGRSEFTVFPPSPGLAKTLDYTAKIRNLTAGEVVVFQNKEGKYLAVKVLEINDKQAGAPENLLTIRWKAL